MRGILYFTSLVHQNIINKDNHKSRSKNGLNTRFIKSIKTAGALFNLKDITKDHSVQPHPKMQSQIHLHFYFSTDNILTSYQSQETSNSLQLIQQFINPQKRILILSITIILYITVRIKSDSTTMLTSAITQIL